MLCSFSTRRPRLALVMIYHVVPLMLQSFESSAVYERSCTVYLLLTQTVSV